MPKFIFLMTPFAMNRKVKINKDTFGFALKIKQLAEQLQHNHGFTALILPVSLLMHLPVIMCWRLQRRRKQPVGAYKQNETRSLLQLYSNRFIIHFSCFIFNSIISNALRIEGRKESNLIGTKAFNNSPLFSTKTREEDHLHKEM